MTGKVKTLLTYSLWGVTGALLGIVAAVSVLALVFVFTWGGNSLAIGFVFVPMLVLTLPVGAIAGAVVSTKLLGSIRSEDDPRKKKARRSLVAYMALAPLALCGLAYWATFHMEDQPTDGELIANFKAHEATFQKLAEMAEADPGLTRVDEDWTDPKDPGSVGVSRDRIENYRYLCREAHVPRGLTRSEDGVEFMYWGIGSAVSDDLDKGYAYLARRPDKIHGKLDGFEPSGRVAEKQYRWIRGNWYLYVSYIPD